MYINFIHTLIIILMSFLEFSELTVKATMSDCFTSILWAGTVTVSIISVTSVSQYPDTLSMTYFDFLLNEKEMNLLLFLLVNFDIREVSQLRCSCPRLESVCNF